MKGWTMASRLMRMRGWLNNPETAHMPAIPMPADCAKHGGIGDEADCTWCLLNRLLYEDEDDASSANPS